MIILQNILPDHLLIHWALFVEALCILNEDKLSIQELDRADKLLHNLLLKSPAMRDRPLASLRLSSRRRIWVSKILKGSLGEKWQLYTRTPATSTQKNPATVSRKSAMLKSGLQKRIPALLDASWYQAVFSDHFCCSLMSNTSATLSLSVCIRRSWASFPLPRFSCRNFTFHPSTSGAPP